MAVAHISDGFNLEFFILVSQLTDTAIIQSQTPWLTRVNKPHKSGNGHAVANHDGIAATLAFNFLGNIGKT